MKKNKFILSFIAGIAVMGLVSFKMAYDSKKSTAEVEQIEGMYIYTDSKPVMEYEYLGTVKRNTGGFGDGSYTGVRDGLIKRAKNEFPTGEALILQLRSGSADKADVIKFK